MYMVVYEKNKKRLENYDRIKQVLPSLKKFKAIDSINEKNNSIKINEKNNFNTDKIVNDKLKGKLGCNLSQQILWMNHLKNDKDWLLILEDDTEIFVDNSSIFDEKINKLIDFADKNNSNFIQLEVRNHHLKEQIKYPQTEIKNLYIMKPQCGMSAYLINKKAINYFFNLLPWEKYIDIYTSDKNNISKLKSLCYVNDIFKTGGAQRWIDKKSKLGSIIYNIK